MSRDLAHRKTLDMFLELGIYLLLLTGGIAPLRAAGIYTIQERIGDDRLRINGVLFQMHSPCPDLQAEDPVMFLEGSPYGSCVTAQILNLRNKRHCSLQCPAPSLDPNTYRRAGRDLMPQPIPLRLSRQGLVAASRPKELNWAKTHGLNAAYTAAK